MTDTGELAEAGLTLSPMVGTDECWVWSRGKGAGGYGVLQGRYVHRLAYEQWVGPIPAGMAIHHHCRNKACFNPTHLEAVTSKEHLLLHAEDLGRRGGKVKTEHDTCPQGHLYTSENVKVRKNGKRECRICHRDSQRERGRRARAPRMAQWHERNAQIRMLAERGHSREDIALLVGTSTATVRRVLIGELKTA